MRKNGSNGQHWICQQAAVILCPGPPKKLFLICPICFFSAFTQYDGQCLRCFSFFPSGWFFFSQLVVKFWLLRFLLLLLSISSLSDFAQRDECQEFVFAMMVICDVAGAANNSIIC
jgi:hypothetical protein